MQLRPFLHPGALLALSCQDPGARNVQRLCQNHSYPVHEPLGVYEPPGVHEPMDTHEPREVYGSP